MVVLDTDTVIGSYVSKQEPMSPAKISHYGRKTWMHATPNKLQKLAYTKALRQSPVAN